MSDPAGPVAWLSACYDRAEQRARAATDGPWRVAECGEVETVTAYGTPGYESPLHVTCDNSGGAPSVGEEDAEFIADHDPSWRLADIARKRKILECHSPVEDGLGHLGDLSYGEISPACRACGVPSEYAVQWPCPTLRLLAEEFDGEPGYDESWRP